MAITIEQLLALLAVDAATASTASGQYVVLQRDPQPSEIDIDIATGVFLRLVDLDGDPEDAGAAIPDFEVSIEGTKVMDYVSGVDTYYASWTGSVSLFASTDPFVFLDLTLTQPGGGVFTSEQVVDVQVDVDSGTAVFDYSFTIEDLTPPRLLTAEAIAPEVARVTFDDAMAITGAGSVLALGNWPAGALTTQNVDPSPGVDLEVTAVAAVAGSGDTQFDLTFQWEMTPGCDYLVTVAPAVEDSSGNAIDPDYDTATLVGFEPEFPAGRFFDYWFQCLPLKNRQEDDTQDLERFSNCIQEVLTWIMYELDHFTDQFDPDRMTDEQITLALWDMGNPFDVDELGLTEVQQRKLLRYLLPIYKSKGTAVGIEQAILFLLGEIVTVVPYIGDGWILGVDALGSGTIAEVMNGAGDPYDFSVIAPPWELAVVVDEGTPQTVTFVSGDFADPANATAAEVVAVLVAQLTSGGARVLAPGQPAVVTGTNTEPFAISPGDALVVTVQGTPHTVTFAIPDIATPGAATLDEVLAKLNHDLAGAVIAADDGAGQVQLETVERSDSAAMTVSAGVVQAALALPTSAAAGGDQPQLSVYSTTVGRGASIQVTGGSANAALAFDDTESGATGGAVLAPSNSYIKYSFDIETATVVDSETEQQIRDIAEYMKPAHTHLIHIRTALPVPWPDSWQLGVSELDESTELGP